jgi:N-acetylglucosamine kinase-like BadF-type ATPase
MPRYYLGVDVGGTKTHALVADETGKAVGFSETGPGNHEVVGYDGLVAALKETTGSALTMAGIGSADIAGAGFGVAGYDFPSERQPTLEAIATLGLAYPVEAVNDVFIGLIAGASQGWGVAIDSGTGTNCWGRDRNGRVGWITGCGDPFGEHGGAGDLVAQAIRAISHEWSRRGPPTQLTPAFLKLVGADSLDQFIEGLALRWYTFYPDAAPLVFQVANDGDPVAREIIAWLGQELGWSVIAVIRQLEIQALEFEVVLIGSLFKGGPMLIEPLKQTVLQEASRACFVHLSAPPVVGGVLLGMEVAGVQGNELRQKLIDSTLDLIRSSQNK